MIFGKTQNSLYFLNRRCIPILTKFNDFRVDMRIFYHNHLRKFKQIVLNNVYKVQGHRWSHPNVVEIPTKGCSIRKNSRKLLAGISYNCFITFNFSWSIYFLTVKINICSKEAIKIAIIKESFLFENFFLNTTVHHNKHIRDLLKLLPHIR